MYVSPSGIRQTKSADREKFLRVKGAQKVPKYRNFSPGNYSHKAASKPNLRENASKRKGHFATKELMPKDEQQTKESAQAQKTTRTQSLQYMENINMASSSGE
jgi:hypothetical protein